MGQCTSYFDATPTCSQNPATFSTPSLNGSSHASSVCTANTLRPYCSRMTMRYVIDEPVHRNVGDHLIHLGIERFFHDHGMRIVARAHTYSYHRRWLGRRISQDTVIVCNGGGHLGDLYPAHQELREQLVIDFPLHRIVVLPQSLYFKDDGRIRQAADIYRGHPDFHLFLRDPDSLRGAEAMGLDRLYLAPDMAHALYPLQLPKHALASLRQPLYLLRRDTEDAAGGRTEHGVDDVLDWPDIVRPRDTVALAALAAAFRLLRRVGPPRALNVLLDQRRTILIERGVALLAAHDLIITSRLHGALLGLLLGKRVRLLPSLTGKSSAYYDTWLTDHERCEYVPAGLTSSTDH